MRKYVETYMTLTDFDLISSYIWQHQNKAANKDMPQPTKRIMGKDTLYLMSKIGRKIESWFKEVPPFPISSQWIWVLVCILLGHGSRVNPNYNNAPRQPDQPSTKL